MCYQNLAKATAARFHLPPELVCAVCEQESNWNPWAIRVEWGFYNKYVTPMDLSDTEEISRSVSWGLMQVMGETAREDEWFKGRYLSELCDPAMNLEVGCRILKKKLDKADGDWRKALLFWNGGNRPAYADEVLARVPRYLQTGS